jgi:hypothetical protein
MPNWETNNTIIIGAPENIRRFVAEAFVHPGQPYPGSTEDINTKSIPLLSFELIVPSPPNKEVGGCDGEHEDGVVCWYQWNLENWGTKWSSTEHTYFNLRWFEKYGESREVYGRVDLVFETAWSAPTPIFEAIEKRWDVTVHCVTQDEGGFPDVEYGDPYGEELIRRIVTMEFDSYERVVDEPAVSA